ncbi:hypothetical protein FJ251_00170 [bacterium]|nr:hypothetical protein [bacterium]
MGIDYVIPFPCQNREELGEPGLRRWTFLFMVHKYLAERPELNRHGLADKQWQMPSYRGEQVEPEAFTIEDVRKVGADIGKRLRICRDCPANLDPKAEEFGCVGRINYPLLASFEEFLGERLQPLIDRRGVEEWPTLLNLILRTDSPFTGAPVARLRATELRGGSRLLERHEPVAFRRAGDGISTDHILHALLGLASPNSADTGYAREIPRELLSIYLDFLAGVLYERMSEERVIDFSRSCSTYLQFRWLHRALRLAFKLDLPLLIH